MATSNEKHVQLKRETLLNDVPVLEDVFPKTMTDAVIDSESGMTLSQALDTILTAINNKLSRNVNSVNGRSGVVILDSSDVGLGNVDNVSTADIKAWVINYISDQFHDKRLLVRDYYSQIQAIIESDNDLYDGVPFVCEHATEDANDQTMVIGVMYKTEGVWHVDSKSFDFGAGTGVGRIEYDQNNNPLGEYFNVYEGAQRNQALGLYSTAKGIGNVTNAEASMVCGSLNDINANSANSFVTGRGNHATYNDNGIVFGRGNTSAGRSSLMGGFSNSDTGGTNNIVSGSKNVMTSSTFNDIVVGEFNNVTSVGNSIIAGYENTINEEQTIDKRMSSIIAGKGNIITDGFCFVTAGENNTIINTENCTVSGFSNDVEDTNESFIVGRLNSAKSGNVQQFIVGKHAVASGARTSVFGELTEGHGTNSIIFGKSSNGFNPETVSYDHYTYTRYQGVQNMSHRDMIVAHRTTPFSIAYGDNSFVAGQDNLGFGEDSFTIGKQNINDSMDSFVTGRYNIAAEAEGIVISGTQNIIVGKYSQGSGLRNCTSGHLASVFGAFNNAENYAMTIGIGSTADYENNYATYQNDFLKLRYYSNDYITSQTYMIRKANYIELPLPLMNEPVRAEEIKIRITYEGNVWSSNTLRESQIIGNNRPVFVWYDDSKSLRVSREDLANRFGFQHFIEQGATSYDLDAIDLREAEFVVNISIGPNFADRIFEAAFKVGNGPFADSIYADDNLRANAFEVLWDGRTRTQKDILLRYKADPNTLDDPTEISFKKLIDTLIANGTISLNDIVS